MSDLTSAVGWIALGGAAAAGLALVLALAFYLKLRRVRRAQVVLLGGGKDDLVDFAVSLQTRIDDVHRAVDEVAAALSRIDTRVDGCLSHTSIVRYDAYERTLEVLERETVFVAEIEGTPAGYVSLDPGEDSVRVDQIFVSPEHEAEGVGRQLLEYAEGYAIWHGATRLQVVVEGGNERALEFYRGRGFVSVS